MFVRFIQACGPLKTKLAEYNACYDAMSVNIASEVPCPDVSEDGTQIRKMCRPSHALDKFGEPIKDVTYTCRKRRWTYSNGCQSG